MYEKAIKYIVGERNIAFNKLEDVLLSYDNGVIGKDDYEFEVKCILSGFQLYKILIFDRFGNGLNDEQWKDISKMFDNYFLQIRKVYILKEERMAW